MSEETTVQNEPKPKKQTPLFEKMLTALDWEPSKKNQGIPGYFPEKPAGHRALWTVRWSSGLSRKMITPNDLMPLENMTMAQKAVEILDYSSRGNDAAARVLGDIGNLSRFRLGAVSVIGEARKTVPEFVFQEVPPQSIFIRRMVIRPGWEARDG